MELLSNIDNIKKELESKLDTVTSIYKLDGITLECKLKSRQKLTNVSKQLEEICGELELLPISIEQNEDDKSIFALQFPELYPIYTEDERRKIYIDSFTWLFNNAIQRNNVSQNKVVIDKSTILNGKDVYIKQALGIYCRSHINPYKSSVKTFMEDKKYMSELTMLFYEALEKYSKEVGI